jgi:hypothetical protein
VSKSHRRPIIDPLLLALKSRRVLIAVAALLVGLLMSVLPELEPARDELLMLLITLALALIGGYSIEDAASAGRERASQQNQELRRLVKDVIGEVIDEIGQKGQVTDE